MIYDASSLKLVKLGNYFSKDPQAIDGDISVDAKNTLGSYAKPGPTIARL